MVPIRVLYVNHATARGGCAASLRFLIESFPAGAVAPHVVCPPGPAADDFEQAGIPVTRVPAVSIFEAIDGLPPRGLRLLIVGRSLWNMRYGKSLRTAIRALRPDVVHLNDFGMVQAARAAHALGVPVVSHARYVADRTVGWWQRLTHGVARRYLSTIFAIDGSVRHALRELRNVQIVYNPLSPEILRRMPRLAVPDTTRPLSVVYLGGLHPKKGIFDVVECIRRVSVRSDIVFHIVGGNTRPREFYQTWKGRLATRLGFIADVEHQLREFVSANALADRVHVHGYVGRPSDLLADADILLAPSQTNGLGRSVFEAGALGVPSVVTLRDRIQDIVEHEVTGLIVPEGDHDALARAVVRCVEDRALVAAMGEQCVKKYRTQFDPVLAATQVLDTYRHVRPSATDAAETALAGTAT